MLDQKLVDALEDPSRFHYRDLWLQEADPLRRKLLELFTFGTVQDIQDDIPMTAGMLRKLQLLTIVSLSERLREIPYSLIQERCGLQDLDTIEECLMQLRAFFQVKLDSPAQLAHIEQWFDCRDVFGDERDLILLPRPSTTRETLLKDLQEWRRKLRSDILGHDH